MRWLAAALLVACHSGVDGDVATSWLRARGAAVSTWEPCLRIGTAMHAACGADGACGLEATRTFTYWCYAGRYARHANGADPLALSPCFWSNVNLHGDRFTQPGEARYVTFDAWSTQVCAQFALPTQPCVRELRDVVQSCTIDLTGAGP